MMVTSHIASRLLARSAVYPGLTGIVADLVSSGGSELYGVKVPRDCVGLSMEEASYRLRAEHQAILLAVRRDGRVQFHAPREFELRENDDLVVIAESLGRLAPSAAATDTKRSASGIPAAPAASAVPAPAATPSARDDLLAAPSREVSSTPQGS
jgi:voltage-gated potassium channel